ncbi:MAG: hypothetical protein R2861_04550 [Desulfobacterales bacterium]
MDRMTLAMTSVTRTWIQKRAGILDIGLKTRNDRLQTMVSVFCNMVDDYIVKENQGDGNYRYMNYAEVFLYGAEAGTDYYLGAGFSTFASVSTYTAKMTIQERIFPASRP